MSIHKDESMEVFEPLIIYNFETNDICPDNIDLENEIVGNQSSEKINCNQNVDVSEGNNIKFIKKGYKTIAVIEPQRKCKNSSTRTDQHHIDCQNENDDCGKVDSDNVDKQATNNARDEGKSISIGNMFEKEIASVLAFYYDVKNKHSSFPCCTCRNKTYNTFEKMYRHVISEHKDFITCPKCRKHVRLETLSKHQKSHEDVASLLAIHYDATNKEPPFSCLTCANKSFNTYKMLYKHIVNSHKELSTCPNCGKRVHARNMPRHLKSHKTKAVEQCEYCGVSFKNLPVHIRLVHERERHLRHKCDDCGNAYLLPCLLQKHMEDEGHGGFEKQVVHDCKICHTRVRSEEALNEHMKNQHEDVSFECAHCAQEFNSRRLIRRHLRTVHPFPRDHVCQICAKAFVRLSDLKSHLKNHIESVAAEPSNEIVVDETATKIGRDDGVSLKSIRFLYRCEICGKREMTEESLNEHTRNTHNG